MNSLSRCWYAIIGALLLSPFSSASETLSTKSLKHVTIVPSSSVWKLREDAEMSASSASYSIEHRGNDAMIVVMLVEHRDSPFELAHEKFWAEYKSDMRPKFKVFREVPLPKGFVVPRGFGCNADEGSMTSTMPVSTTVTCTSSQKKNQLVATITVSKWTDTQRYMPDVNALLATIAWK